MSKQYEAPPSPPEGQSPGPNQPQPYVSDRPRRTGIGVAAFICGLLSVIMFWGVGFYFGPLAIILGGVRIWTARKSGAGIGLAVAGLTLGCVSLALFGWMVFGSSGA